jgi:probable O-glycosylation ligase (exosortase A-associated)
LLRTVFVLVIVVFGLFYAVQSPFYFLLFYLWYAYFRPDAWIYWMSWVQSLNLSLFLGAGVLLSTLASTPRLRLNATIGMMMLFLLHSLFTAIFSAHPDVSWASWWVFLRVWLISYTIILLVRDLQRYRLTVLIIAVSLGFEAAKQGWAGFVLNPGGSNNNTLPFLGDNNGVAVGMMMLVPLFGAFAQTTARRWERTVYWILGFGVFVRGLTTYSRGGFLAALVLAIVYWLQSQKKIRTLVSLALVATLALSVMPQDFWDRMHTITSPSQERDESARGRLYFWEVAKDMAAAKPIVGVGFDGFERSYNAYDKSGGIFGGDRAVHSTWFGVLADTGYLGFAFFASLFLQTCWCLFNVGRRRLQTAGADIRIHSRALFTSLLAFAVGGTFVNLQYNEMLWHFIALAAVLQLLAADASAPVGVLTSSSSGQGELQVQQGLPIA